MTSDICKVQSSFCPGRPGAAWHGELTAAVGCGTTAEAQCLSRWAPLGAGGGERGALKGQVPAARCFFRPLASSTLE